MRKAPPKKVPIWVTQLMYNRKKILLKCIQLYLYKNVISKERERVQERWTLTGTNITKQLIVTNFCLSTKIIIIIIILLLARVANWSKFYTYGLILLS